MHLPTEPDVRGPARFGSGSLKPCDAAFAGLGGVEREWRWTDR
jgi:hypothetical protein